MRNIAKARMTEVRPTPSVQPVFAATYRFVALSTPPSRNPVAAARSVSCGMSPRKTLWQPPTVLLLAGPVADLVVGEVRKRHRRVVLRWMSRIAALSRLRAHRHRGIGSTAAFTGLLLDAAYAAVLIDAPTEV
jgi:hypothetical protein